MDPIQQKSEESYVNGICTIDSVVDIAKGDEIANPKLDKHGLPLVPQPTPFSDDPLVS